MIYPVSKLEIDLDICNNKNNFYRFVLISDSYIEQIFSLSFFKPCLIDNRK